jgi:hypothetical protein
MRRTRPPWLVATLAIAAVFAVAAPAIAGVGSSRINATTVDGFHAVGCAAPSADRSGKLVAACSNGQLPNNIIARAPNAARLGGAVPSAYLRGQFVSTRDFTCSPGGFVPTSPGAYFSTGYELTVNGPAALSFACNSALPDGATVGHMTLVAQDFDPGGSIDCNLWRSQLFPPIATLSNMALAGTSVAFNGGAITVTTGDIATPEVENGNFSYYVECDLSSSSGHQVGVYGVTLEYTVNEADG